MKTIPKTQAMQQAANQHFRLGVATFDSPHLFGAFDGGESVRHREES